MKQVLFVCLGNICRSPLAQGIFERKIKEQKLHNIYNADSAGTSGWHQGEKPHSGSRKKAIEYNLNLEKQRSRAVHLKDKDIFDYIVAMDSSNYSNLTREFHVPKEKLILMRHFDHKGKDLDVPDPWGQGEDSFEEVYNILDRSMDSFIEWLKERN